MLTGLIFALLITGALSVVLDRYMSEQERKNKARIVGEWIELNVPKFARDRFVVRKEGVYVNERIVDTQYIFNGSELSYHYEGKVYRYRVKDDEMTLLERVAPTHYRSTFQLVGSEPVAESEPE